MKSLSSVIIFGFSILMYVLSLITLVTFALFMQNIGKYTISAIAAPEILSPGSLIINLVLITQFGVLHSVLARPGFKSWFTKFLDPALIRPTYLLVSVLTLNIVMLFWRPFGEVIYDVRGTAIGTFLVVCYIVGWIVEVASSFQINHFHLFGLSQAYSKLKQLPIKTPEFKIPLFYRYVRHPIYSGWLMVFWLTPVLTYSHLLFALAMTVYIRIATHFEERDLIEHYQTTYIAYMANVPYKYIPHLI